jgi:hypothetical protein
MREIANRCSENGAQVRNLRMTVRNQNLIQGEIKRKLKSGNACYRLVSDLLSSRLLSKNVNVRLYKVIILHVVLYGCETWSLRLREGHRLRVFEDRVLRRIFGPKRDEVRLDAEVKEDEMSRACNRNGEEEERI